MIWVAVPLGLFVVYLLVRGPWPGRESADKLGVGGSSSEEGVATNSAGMTATVGADSSSRVTVLARSRGRGHDREDGAA